MVPISDHCLGRNLGLPIMVLAPIVDAFFFDVALSWLGIDGIWIAREMLAFDVEVDEVTIHFFRP